MQQDGAAVSKFVFSQAGQMVMPSLQLFIEAHWQPHGIQGQMFNMFLAVGTHQPWFNNFVKRSQLNQMVSQ